MTLDNQHNLWDEVVFCPTLKYWTIAVKHKLHELQPITWKLVWINMFNSRFWWESYSYTVEYKWYVYDKIHTVFSTEDEYYKHIADQIMRWAKASTKENMLEIIKNAVKSFFN